MTTSNNLRTAQDFVQAIESNVSAMYARAIDFATFSSNQKAIWALADSCGVGREAVALLANVK